MPGPLAEAYAKAAYRLFLPSGVWSRRVGITDSAADAALRDAGCVAHWHFITPCNPGSQRLNDTENNERLRRFADELGTHAWAHVAAISAADDGSWREAGYAIFDAEPDAMLALAGAYQQNALLHARLGAAPRLVWLKSQRLRP